MNKRVLLARWHSGISIGRFIEDAAGDIRFEYDPDYRGIPLSISLPLSPARTASSAAARFLDNLLPTPSSARGKLAQYQLQEPASDFTLLGAIGRECPGRLVLTEPGSRANSSIEHHFELHQRSFDTWLANRSSQPLMPNARGSVECTLAGSRPKAALNFTDSNKIRVPLGAGSSTHIIKAPRPDDESGAVYEEWFCMKLVEALLGQHQAAAVNVWQGCLRVRRYDRQPSSQAISRIHQEDFAQALGLSSTQSSTDPVGAEPGPESQLARAAALIDQLGRQGRMAVPALQKALFFRQLLVRLLFGDPGLGLKKFSLIHHDDGRAELAPMYGLRCGLTAEPRARPNPGLIVGQGRHTDQVTERHCIDCGTLQLGLTARYARTEFERLGKSLIRILRMKSAQLIRQQPSAEPAIDRITRALLERLR